MKIGLFGGTFDPIHTGHLSVAEAAMESISLDKLLVIPNGDPPLKYGVTPYHHRYAMCSLACQGYDGIEVSDIDYHTLKPSYTRYTIEVAQQRYPDDDLYFVCGMDAYNSMHTWPGCELFAVNLKGFIVASRPNCEPNEGMFYDLLRGKVNFINQLWLDISSSEIRDSIVDEQPISNHIVPPAVLEYINKQGLYQ